MKSKETILITSNEPWGEVWYSKQHYANELSKLGHSIYFLNPPTSWKLSNLWDWKISINQVQDALYVISYSNFLPLRFWVRQIGYLNDWVNCKKINKKLKLGKFIFWQFDPNRFEFFKLSRSYLAGRIYHVTDQFYHLPLDRILASKATLIPCTSYPHFIRYKDSFGNKAIHVPHGIPELPNIKKYSPSVIMKKMILLIGTMNDDYDLALLKAIVDNIDESKLTIIGPTNFKSETKKIDFHKLIQKENVAYLGPLHSNDLMNEISKVAVCISPYDFQMKRVGSSLKIMNYLLGLKPVVTSVLEGFESIEGEGVFYATNEGDFIKAINDILSNHKSFSIDKVMAFLNERHYSKLILRILNDFKKRIN